MSITSRSDSHITINGRKGSSRPMEGGATFTLTHRLQRLFWQLTWFSLAAWTPSFLWRWRAMILRAFGAQIHKTAIVRGSARIWWPGNLVMDAHSSLGPGFFVITLRKSHWLLMPSSRNVPICAPQATISISTTSRSLQLRLSSGLVRG